VAFVKKIPTLFRRDPEDMRRVLPEVTPGCEWVMAGEGTPTRKYDGTCVMFDGEHWFARREVKQGKAAPPGFQAIEMDEVTGKTVGWEPIEQSGYARWQAEAVREANEAADEAERSEPWPVGTYELIGPKVNGNPEHEEGHVLITHRFAEEVFVGPPAAYSYDLLRQEVVNLRDVYGAEGVVWHHPDGRMAKLKARDFR
jgi:hypothetical protein